MILSLIFLACYKIDYYYGVPGQGEPDHEVWRHRFVYGAVEVEGPLRIPEYCPQGAQMIHTEISVENSLASAAAEQVAQVTGLEDAGGYNPSTISLWCADAPPLKPAEP